MDNLQLLIIDENNECEDVICHLLKDHGIPHAVDRRATVPKDIKYDLAILCAKHQALEHSCEMVQEIRKRNANIDIYCIISNVDCGYIKSILACGATGIMGDDDLRDSLASVAKVTYLTKRKFKNLCTKLDSLKSRVLVELKAT